MMRFLTPTLIPIVLAACAAPNPASPPTVPAPVDASAPPPPSPEARTVEEFDTTSAAAREDATSVDSAGTFLGSDIASLGDPTRPGFWIETPLATTPGKGRVTLSGDGGGVEVDLIPSESGSRLSLAAIRLLEVSLTDLPTVDVYAF